MMMKFYNILILFLFSTGVFAQIPVNTNSKYGNDSASCISNLSTMIEFAKIKVYDYALPAWRYVFVNCPKASKNIYINGASIFKNLIDQQENQLLKEKYVDTLMMIYDYRMQYFGEEGFVNIRKGMDLYSYRPSEKQSIYQYLEKGIQLSGIKTEFNALITFLQVSITLASEDKLPKEKVVDNYNQVSKIIEQLENANPADATAAQSRNIIDKMFAGSGLADCTKSNEIYLEKLKDANITANQIKQIIKTLEISRCNDSEAYNKASELLYKLEPTSANAYSFAKLYLKKQNYQKAEEYYLLAIKGESSPEILANLYYETAVVQYSGLNQPSKARENALKAANAKKDWGQPYMLIGNMYAAANGSCTGNEVEKNSVFWAAVDKFVLAKSIDTNVADEANNLIARYSAYFPNSETLFFYGIKNGDNYMVKCWINENTKVRAR